MANKTATDYQQERLNQLNADTEKSYTTWQTNNDKLKADRTASTQTYITGQNEIIDAAADNSIRKVQQQIDEAPGVYQSDFDRNAIAEMVNRKKLEESMANMGLTDSGLNRTQQTALSVQKGNADAATHKSMREYVNKLENAITDLEVQRENDKKQLALDKRYQDDQYFQSLDNELNTWRSNAMDTNLTNSYTYGDTMWQADEANRATVEAANIAAAAEIEAAGIKAQRTNADKLTEYAQFMMKNMGYSEDAAIAAAISMYPTGDKTADTYAKNYSAAIKAGYSDTEAAAYANAGGGTAGEIAAANQRIGAANVNVTGLTKVYGGGTGFGDLWTDSDADLKHAKGGGWTQTNWNKSIERAVDKVISKLKNSGLSDNDKKIAAAQAVGYTYAGAVNSKTEDKFIEAMIKQFSGAALQAALSAAGISEK